MGSFLLRQTPLCRRTSHFTITSSPHHTPPNTHHPPPQPERTMGNLLAPQKKISTQDQAVLDLKIQRDRLKQYQKRIHTVIAKELQVAKQLYATGEAADKKRALLTMRKKKYQESLLAKADQQLMNLEEMVSVCVVCMRDPLPYYDCSDDLSCHI